MRKVRREVWHDGGTGRFWALELFEGEIIGCFGPFQDEAALPSLLDVIPFERNPEILRWIRQRHASYARQLTGASAVAA